mmetsp:Transcript_12251/g.31048  ORF Transcript_12251/g.31048 Transcript_12251/m.31048 type:complete len:251 (+) Transcript_12251:873-1625(+)
MSSSLCFFWYSRSSAIRCSCSAISSGTCSSLLARSKWSIDLDRRCSLRACSCLSLICSWIACCRSCTLSTRSPSLRSFRTPAASISARVSSSSCSSRSLLILSSSLRALSACSRLFSSSARAFSSWMRLFSSSFSFSCSICSYSSFLRSMITLRARMRLCSLSTSLRISSMAFTLAECLAASASTPASRCWIIDTALFSRLPSSDRCDFTLSLSKVCRPHTTTLFLWSMRTCRWLFLTASTRRRSTSSNL